MMNKKGVSIMIGYVLLISMALVIGILIFNWAKTLVPQEEVACPEGASLVVNSASCIGGSLVLELTNNGKRRIDSIYLKGKTSEDRTLANLDLTPIGSGGIQALSTAKTPGQNEFVSVKFDTERCDQAGISDCTTTNFCAGTFDCSKIDAGYFGSLNNAAGACFAAKNDYNLNCELVYEPDGITFKECKGVDSCSKLSDADCSDPNLMNEGCSPSSASHYQIYEIEITPERQQLNDKGQNESVVCNDFIIKQKLNSCLIYETTP